MNPAIDNCIAEAVKLYAEGAYRARLVHDLILADATAFGDRPVFLDIGCGKGFDSDIPLQISLARSAGAYIGVEPDTAVTPDGHVTDLRRGFFEQTDVAPGSVQVAFAIMVLEHLEHPQPFWDKLYEVLAPGGVFWGLTVDARHWFASASIWSERLRVKDWYLNRLMGDRGKERYENYPVHYRSNTPAACASFAGRFSEVRCINFARVGQCDPLFPRVFQPLSRWFETRRVRRGKPGTLLAVRAVK